MDKTSKSDVNSQVSVEVAEEASQTDETGQIRRDAEIACENLNKSIQELESLFASPKAYIGEEIGELKRRVESKREELKLIIDREADKLIITLDELERELVDKAKSSKHEEDKKTVVEKAQNTLADWNEKLKQTQIRKKDELKAIVESGEKINSNLSGLVEAVRDGLLTSKYQEDREAVILFSKVNIHSNLCFWKIHSQIIHMIFQSDFFKACGFHPGQNWNLLYRSSGSDYSGFELLSHCSGKSPTLIIIELHNRTIVGGYTEIRWEKASEEIDDKNAFVFRKRTGENSFEVFKEKNFKVVCDPSCGPSFIDANGFRVGRNSSILLYQNVAKDENADRFMIRGIEVFRRVKKRVDFCNKETAEKCSKEKYKSMLESLQIWG